MYQRGCWYGLHLSEQLKKVGEATVYVDILWLQEATGVQKCSLRAESSAISVLIEQQRNYVTSLILPGF